MGYHFHNPHKNKVYVARYAELFENNLKFTKSSGSLTLLKASGSIIEYTMEQQLTLLCDIDPMMDDVKGLDVVLQDAEERLPMFQADVLKDGRFDQFSDERNNIYEQISDLALGGVVVHIRNELLRAVDLQFIALKYEVAVTFDQAISGIYSTKDISDLENFPHISVKGNLQCYFLVYAYANQELIMAKGSINLLSLTTADVTKLMLYQGIEKQTTKLQGSDEGVAARHESGHAVIGTDVSTLLEGQPRVEVRHI
ncbi:hypothetical protein Tco_1293928 [Tanacetum coccineum]